MNTLFAISPEKMKITYDQLKNYLKQDQQIIFNALKMLDKEFEMPEISELSLKNKHEEIKKKFDFSNFSGTNIFLGLIPQIYKILKESGRYDDDELDIFLKKTATETKNSSAKLVLTKDCIWTVEWFLEVRSVFGDEKMNLQISLYDSELNEIVPEYMFELLSSAISAYMQNLFMPSVILLSIALEAILREILLLKGYSAGTGGNSNAEYSFIEAEMLLCTQNSGHLIRLNSDDIKLPIERWNPQTIPIRIKRKYNKKNHYDIIIRGLDGYEDYITTDTIESLPNKKISGLGGAIKIARDQEKVLTDMDIPKDMDEVFCGVRNNLIHISKESFDKDISGSQPLKSILTNQAMVCDLLINVARYVNKKWYEIYDSN